MGLECVGKMSHGPLTIYVKLRNVHAPEMPGTFSPPPTSKETASKQSRHASRHVHDARAVMQIGIANLRWRGKRSSIPGACAFHNFTYLVRGPWSRDSVSKSSYAWDMRTDTTRPHSTIRCQAICVISSIIKCWFRIYMGSNLGL